MRVYWLAAMPLMILLFVCWPAAFADEVPGKRLFESQCAVCHGVLGGGGRGPGLNRPKLNHAPDDDALKNVILRGIPPEMPGAWQLSPNELAALAAYVRVLGQSARQPVTGNIESGSKLYSSNGCAACHIIAGAGAGYGPELTSIGARRSAEHLRQSVIAPSAVVPGEFASVEAVTRSGERFEGIRLNEDSFTIQIRTAPGKFRSFRKSELRSLKIDLEQSRMPAYTRLTAEQLDDLVAYLASLGGER